MSVDGRTADILTSNFNSGCRLFKSGTGAIVLHNLHTRLNACSMMLYDILD